MKCITFKIFPVYCLIVHKAIVLETRWRLKQHYHRLFRALYKRHERSAGPKYP